MTEAAADSSPAVAIERYDRNVLASAARVLALARHRQAPMCTHQEELAQLLMDVTERSRGSRLDLAWAATFCGFDDTGEIIRRHAAAEAEALRAPLGTRLRELAKRIVAAMLGWRRLQETVRQPWPSLRPSRRSAPSSGA